jgi:Domain of unknown function (DUF4041)/T5orf172 domain
MPITDIFRVNSIKADLERVQKERDAFQKTLSETERMDHVQLQQAIAALQQQKETLNREVADAQASVARAKRGLEEQVQGLYAQIVAKQSELVILDDAILLQSFGFYKPKYDLENSTAYRGKLNEIRAKQAAFIKAGQAASGSISWTVNNSKREGERMVKDYTKLILRSFNNECDASIINVKFNNVESIDKKLRKACETLNKLGKQMSIVISPQYLDLKLQELYLCHEYQVKKQEEKEALKHERERLREEAKVQQEIELAKLKLEKEEHHFNNALAQMNAQLAAATTEAERLAVAQEIAEVERKKAELEQRKLTLQYREQHTRAGYVYIISNIGSFGENIYKIGVTRRLEPTERIDELSDASVPFNFDIHAMVFSDDAPSLENALHKAFAQQRLNRINGRREFFSVTLADIEKAVTTNFNKPVEFVQLADAGEYRQSLVLRNIPGLSRP